MRIARERNAEIVRLHASGQSPSAICRALKLTMGQVTDVLHRHPPQRKPPCVRRGELNPNAKLTVEQARQIRERRALGEKLEALAAEFRVDPSLVSLIARGKRWAQA